METIWKVLSCFVALLFLELCNGLPLDLDRSYADGHSQLLTGLIGVLLTICGIVCLAGCLCCQRRNGFKEFRDSPVVVSVASNLDHGHVNPIANGEFTIFTPLSPPHQNNNVFLADQQVFTRDASDLRNGDIDVSSWFGPNETDFPRTRLKYIRELGKGWFGRVVEGTAQGLVTEGVWTPVVVRILEASANSRQRVLFLNDAQIYRCPPHDNLLRLLGKSLESIPLLLLQECCTQGDIKKYLIQQQSTKEKFLSSDYPLLWCYQLSSALQHLHNYNLVHPDLAARNCQLTPEMNLKLGDYGCGMTDYHEDYYHGTENVPVRWCAPECVNYTATTIQTKNITMAANIWSLGVCFWEIYECGLQPYGHLTDDEVVTKVFGPSNIRLPKPSCVVLYTDYIYRLMQLCWSTHESRPMIAQIDLTFTDLMQVHKNTNKHTSPPRVSIEDFDRRWENSKPNSIVRMDNHVENDLTNITVLNMNMEESKNLSASLHNLAGSLDNLLDKSSSGGNGTMDSWLDAIHDLDSAIALQNISSSDSSPRPNKFEFLLGQRVSSGSETEDEQWKKKIELGAYTEKVRQKSRSVADLMVLTHIDCSESDSPSETPLNSLNYKNVRYTPKQNLDNSLMFGSEGNLLSVHDTFQEELRKLQEERRDSLLFVPDTLKGSQFLPDASKKLIEDLNSPSKIEPQSQIFNVYNVAISPKYSPIHTNLKEIINYNEKVLPDLVLEAIENKQEVPKLTEMIENNVELMDFIIARYDKHSDTNRKLPEICVVEKSMRNNDSPNISHVHTVIEKPPAVKENHLPNSNECDKPASQPTVNIVDFVKDSCSLEQTPCDIKAFQQQICDLAKRKDMLQQKMSLERRDDNSIDSGIEFDPNFARSEDISSSSSQENLLDAKDAMMMMASEDFGDVNTDSYKATSAFENRDAKTVKEHEGDTSQNNIVSKNNNEEIRDLESSFKRTDETRNVLAQTVNIFLENEKIAHSDQEELNENTTKPAVYISESSDHIQSDEDSSQLMNCYKYNIKSSGCVNMILQEEILQRYLERQNIELGIHNLGGEDKEKSENQIEFAKEILNQCSKNDVIDVITASKFEISETHISVNTTVNSDNGTENTENEKVIETLNVCKNYITNELQIENVINPHELSVTNSKKSIESLENNEGDKINEVVIDSTINIGTETSLMRPVYDRLEGCEDILIQNSSENGTKEVESLKLDGLAKSLLHEKGEDKYHDSLLPDGDKTEPRTIETNESTHILTNEPEETGRSNNHDDFHSNHHDGSINNENSLICQESDLNNECEGGEIEKLAVEVKELRTYEASLEPNELQISGTSTELNKNVEDSFEQKEQCCKQQRTDNLIHSTAEGVEIVDVTNLSTNYVENIQKNKEVDTGKTDFEISPSTAINKLVEFEGLINKDQVENTTETLLFEDQNVDVERFEKVLENRLIIVENDSEFGHQGSTAGAGLVKFIECVTDFKKHKADSLTQLTPKGTIVKAEEVNTSESVINSEEQEVDSVGEVSYKEKPTVEPNCFEIECRTIDNSKFIMKPKCKKAAEKAVVEVAEVKNTSNEAEFVSVEVTHSEKLVERVLESVTDLEDEVAKEILMEETDIEDCEIEVSSVISDAFEERSNLYRKINPADVNGRGSLELIQTLTEPKLNSLVENTSEIGNIKMITTDFLRKEQCRLEDYKSMKDEFENVSNENNITPLSRIVEMNCTFTNQQGEEQRNKHTFNENEINSTYINETAGINSPQDRSYSTNSSVKHLVEDNEEQFDQDFENQTMNVYSEEQIDSAIAAPNKELIWNQDSSTFMSKELPETESKAKDLTFQQLSNQVENEHQLNTNEEMNLTVSTLPLTHKKKSIRKNLYATSLKDGLIDNDSLNNSSGEEDDTPPQVHFDLSQDQEEMSANSLSLFTSTPYIKKSLQENSVILGACDDYSMEYYSGLKTTISDGEIFSSNFVQPERKNVDLKYSLETWDNFLGRSFDEQHEFDTYEPQSLLFLEDLDESQLKENAADKRGEVKRNDGESKLDVPNNTFEVPKKTAEEDKKVDLKHQSDVGDSTFDAGNKTFDVENCTFDVQKTTSEVPNSTFVKEAIDLDDIKLEMETDVQKKDSDSGGCWENEGSSGWFLHPQTTADDLSGQMDISQDDSYVGFSMDDEIMAAIRNELLTKLPQAQRASSEQIEVGDEYETSDRNEVFVKYNVYNTPLSPIPEESYSELLNSGQSTPHCTINTDLGDSDSDWSEEPGILEEDSHMPDSPHKQRHTPSQDSNCSNDTLFNLDELLQHKEEEGEEESGGNITEVIDSGTVKASEECDSVNEVTILVDSSEAKDITFTMPAREESSSSSETYLTVSESAHVAPLNSPEDRPWKHIEASLSKIEEDANDTIEIVYSFLDDKTNESTADGDSNLYENVEEMNLKNSLANELIAGDFYDCIKTPNDYVNLKQEQLEDDYTDIKSNTIEYANAHEYDTVPSEEMPTYVNDIQDSTYAKVYHDKEYFVDEYEQVERQDSVEDAYGPLTDIRFTGPADSQMMTTSFSDSNDLGDDQDWDSGSDTRSSSSGEFIWKQGENSAKSEPLDEDSSSGSEEDEGEEDGDGPEFVPSAWDKFATPTKSALRSPEKSLERKKGRLVSFKKQKYHCVYEYPREPESPVQRFNIWTDPKYTDWDVETDMFLSGTTDDCSEAVVDTAAGSSPNRSHRNIYQIVNVPEFVGTSLLDDDFYISSSTKPFDMFGGGTTSSQFFPGRHCDWSDFIKNNDNITPDSGAEDVTPASLCDASEYVQLPSKQILPLKTLAQLAINRTNSKQHSNSTEIGGLRHTRDKLKLDLPPSPSAFTKSFSVELPVDPIITRHVPTFTTFGKSRFVVQQVDTPTESGTKNVSFEALPYRPLKQRVESVRGEASLLDSADEDSGIESCTLERKSVS